MNIKRNYRATVLFAAVAATSAWLSRADDLTVTSNTAPTSPATYGNVYVNNGWLRLDGNSKITLTGNGIYLPGEAGGNGLLDITNGGNLIYGSNSRIYVGENQGPGKVNVRGNQDFNASRLIIGGSAVTDSATGYVDFMKISGGPMSDGLPKRIYVGRWMNYARNKVARVLFDGSFAVIAVNSVDPTLSLLWADVNATIAFEGTNGAPVIFGNGSWWSNVLSKNLLTGSGNFKTQGDCEVVFHNHNDNGDWYGFTLNTSTNQLVWTHSGATVITNNCMIKTTADYALPNGSQTGRMEFKGRIARAIPAIDLCGTTQLVNGLYDATPGFNGTVTNSSVTAATLIVGADGGDCDLKIGRVGGDVSFGKVGAGAATVVATNLPAVTVSGGSFMVSGSNLSCGSLTQDGGAVGVVSGATFDLSGAAAGSDVLSHIAVTDGAGGGTFRGATLAASGVIDLSTATPTAEGFGEDTLAVSFADCANHENIQNWTVRVNGAGGNGLGAKISGGNLRIGKTATVIMMR